MENELKKEITKKLKENQMKNQLSTIFDLSIKKELEQYKTNLGELPPDITCQLNETDFTITVKYKGEYLETIQLGDNGGNIALVLSREKHQDIKMIDLERIGAIYSVENSKYELNTINFHLDPSKKTVSVETVLDASTDRTVRKEIIKKINGNSAITILSDGAFSDENFAELAKSVQELNSNLDSSNNFKVSAFQYGPMWIEIEIEKPKTLDNLIKGIDSIRKALLK